jgi:hypothetical protein
MPEQILGGGKRKKSTASKKKGGDFLTGATAAGLILAAEELYRASLKKHNMKGGNDAQLALLNGGKKSRKSSRRRGGTEYDKDGKPIPGTEDKGEDPAPPAEDDVQQAQVEVEAQGDTSLNGLDNSSVITGLETVKTYMNKNYSEKLDGNDIGTKTINEIQNMLTEGGKRRKSSRARRGGDCGIPSTMPQQGGNALNNNVQALFAEAGQATGGIAAPPAMGGKRRYTKRGGNDGSVGATNHPATDPSGLNAAPVGGNQQILPPPPAPAQASPPQVMQPPPLPVNAGAPPEVAPVPPPVTGGKHHRKGRPCEHTKGKRHHSPAHRRGRPCHSGGSLATDATLETSFSPLLEQKVEAGEQGKVGGTHHRKGRPCEHTKGKRHHSPSHRRGRPCHSGGMAAIDQVNELAGQVKGGLNAIY